MASAAILVIDDEQSFLDVIANKLNNYDYKVLQALNGKMGVQVAQKFLPDVIICDWEMPVMNGIDTIKFLKNDSKTKDIPIIMATGGMTSSEDLEVALNAGAVDYIRKPTNPTELIARVNSALKLARSYKEIKYQNIELQQQKEEIQAQQDEILKQNLELQKLSLVARETDNSVVIMDPDGEIEWVNQGFTKLYGYTLEELKKEKGVNILELSKNPNIKKIFETCVKERKSVFYESIFVAKNNKEICIQVSLTPVYDDNIEEGLIKLIAVETDISKIRDLKKFKDSMINMIVHDLKNPLNTIIGFSNLIKENKYFDIIHSAGKQMLYLVENILDVQKFQHTNIELDLKNYNIYDLADLAIQDVQGLKLVSMAGSDLKILNNINPSHIAIFDLKIIRRVLINLLTNAVKYTPPDGEIKLTSSLIQESNKEFIKISVTDNGEGIPKDAIDTIFNQYNQANKKDAGLTSSTGIGLTFCKMVIEAHKGKIGVKSKIGTGSEFYFTLVKF